MAISVGTVRAQAGLACTARPSLSCKCSLGQPSHHRELPGGAYWLSKEACRGDVLYGRDFVLQRPKIGGPGLVLSNKTNKLSCSESKPETHLAVRQEQHSGPPALGGSLWDVTDVTDYTFLGDAGLLPGARTPFLLPGNAVTLSTPDTMSTGIILHPSIERQQTEGEALPDRNPRRTKKVKFTCKLCETTSIKRVSPHGWTAGSVFARCDGCNVVHKLVDNLNIFHDLKGSVFPSKPPTNIKIPKGLPQKPGLDYHVHPAIYPLLPKDE